MEKVKKEKVRHIRVHVECRISTAFVFLPLTLTRTLTLTPSIPPTASPAPLIHNRRLLYHLAKRSPLPSPITITHPSSTRPSARRSSDFILHRPASCLKCCRFLQTYTRRKKKKRNLLLTQILNPPHPYQARTRERADDARAEPDRHRLCEVSVCVVEFEGGRFVDVEDAHCRFVDLEVGWLVGDVVGW
ncbi:uncharacterized protein STEHIDRAFT_129366 [Stereum hirsutum FP-91666 SS1]|uniref:uncharacterized protein n=1 Tax=Stereum hirsutum (strain FP-91666) TaxID=721885 RepID=UPI000440EE86|nr:uncharacterized protein STEHIDRAFT_129366 [Stereum hirsutum FP-91666 SS1]EIM88707.1 hypothetical protein STEHIDRAFT_129366 [Stereum hirsutum FP-91666 SS1]